MKVSRKSASSVSALDPAWLEGHLPRHLWRDGEARWRVTRIQVYHSRQSSQGVKALYKVGLQDPDGRDLQQMYAGYQVAADALLNEYESLAGKATVRPLLGRAALLIPEGNLILLAFPNDRRMPLFYGERLSAWLSIHAPEAAGVKPNGLRWWVREWNVEVLRYIPEKRLTLRCHGRIEADTGVVRDFSFILKQFKNKNNAKRLYQNLTALEKGRAAPLVSIPRAVAFDGDNRLVAMEELKGTSLKRALPEIDIEPVMRAAGEMIATFHQTRGSIPETVSRHDELKEVQDAVKAIGKRLPALRPRLRACLAKCTDLEWTDETPPALLHGSCKLEHMFIHEGELALLDLDGIRRGHPAYDIGEFLSSLYNLEAQGRISSPVRRQIGRCFLQGYAARTPWTISPVAVFWFLAERLIYKQAAKYVEHLHDDCESKVGLMLTLAESVLARCTGLAKQPLGSIWRRLP